MATRNITELKCSCTTICLAGGLVYSKQMSRKRTLRQNAPSRLSSHSYMKKLLLVSAVVLGAVSASQAGVRFNIGFNLPLPAPPVAVISRPPAICAPAPVFTTSTVCEPAPVVTTAPICEQRLAIAPPVIIAPRPVVVRHPVYERRYSHDSRHYASAHWDHYRGH
jgi:hypothetical protein